MKKKHFEEPILNWLNEEITLGLRMELKISLFGYKVRLKNYIFDSNDVLPRQILMIINIDGIQIALTNIMKP